ncbi:helix-turn-helix domain-containing protein [Hathewaya proteolytica]|nr:helix-turn-helix transcriptional regulator [Hathewaya proteolytica]
MEILSLGEKIKRKRKDLSMTLKDLAGDRITPGQISLVESSKSNPSMDLLEYLAERLDTTVEYLMESEETQAEKVCKFFQNVAETYVLQGDAEKSELYIEKALFYASQYKLEYIEAMCLYLRGKIHFIRKEYALAQQVFLSANIIFIKLSRQEETINTFLKLGEITLILKSYELANTYFKQAEKVYMDNDVENDSMIGKIYYYIAYSYFKLDNIEKSMNYSYLAEKKFIQLNDKHEYAKSLLLIGEQYSRKKDLDKAILYSQKSLSIYRQLDDVKCISEIENNIGQLFSNFGNSQEAFLHLGIAEKMRRDNRDPKVVDTLICICEEYIKTKNLDSAKQVLEDIMSEVQNGNKHALVNYYLLKYRVDIQEQNFIEAENTLIIGLNFSKSMGYKREVEQICMILGKFYLDKGDETLAAKYLNEGVELLKELRMVDCI